MKLRKKISSLAILLVFTIIFASTIDAQQRPRRGGDGPRWEQQDRNQNRNQRRNRHQVSQGPSTGAVGAPLDGGLLALLAGAGITYFAARKKKKKNAQE